MALVSEVKRNSEYQARYKAKHPDKVKASGKKYYESNKAILIAKSMARRKRRRDCPIYRKDEKLRFKYKITLDQFNEILKRQKFCCAVCREPFSKTPCVDHCHKVGHIRGLLCSYCNWAIGYLRNSAGIALAAAHYLNQEGLFNGVPLITPSVGRSISKSKSVIPNVEGTNP